MIRPALLAAATFSASLYATAQEQTFLFDNGGPTLTIGGSAPFEVLAGFPSSIIDGAGQTIDANGKTTQRMTGVTFVLVDTDPFTPETVRFVIRSGLRTSEGRMPDLTSPPLFATGPMDTPVLPVPGPLAIRLTTRFAAPFEGAPANDFFIGVEFLTDGGGIATTTQDTGVNANVPRGLAFLRDGGLSEIPGEVPLIGFTTDAPILRLGADIDPNAPTRSTRPNFGLAGVFPDRVRADGVVFDIRDAANPNSLALLIFAPVPFSVGFSLPGVTEGTLFVAPLLTIPITLDASGSATATLLPFPFDATLGGVSSFQAAILARNGRIRLTQALNRTE